MKTINQNKIKTLLAGFVFCISIFSANTVFAYETLTAPVNVKATVPAVGQITISFSKTDSSTRTHVKCSQTSGYYYYEINGGASPITVNVKKDGTTYKKYTCTVASVQTLFSPDDTYGPESLASNEVDPNKADAVVVPTAPGAPQGVVAVPGDKQATITWRAPASDGNGTIIKYVVSTSSSLVGPSANGRDVDPITSTTGFGFDYTYTYTGLTNDKPYTFYVRAENSAGPSVWASSGQVTPKEGAGDTKIGDGGSDPTKIGDPGTEGNPSQDGLSINIAYKNPLHKTASDIPALIAVVLKAVAKLLFPVVVIMILYAGFLFVIARGNTEKIGEAKKALTYAVVGAAIVLGAYGLAQLVQGILASVVS